jgi:hypothetical protein
MSDFRATSFIAATTRVQCSHCGRVTGVLALAVPPNHEVLDAETSDEEGTWQPVAARAFLFYVSHLSEPVLRRVLALCPTYREAYSEVTWNSYWANHCEHCDSLLPDHELHCEPGVFMPINESEAANIELLTIDEPFEAEAAGYALEPEHFQFMQRV